MGDIIRVRTDEADQLLAEWELSMEKRQAEKERWGAELAHVGERFAHFLPYWTFVGRETGEIYRMKGCTSRHADNKDQWVLGEGEELTADADVVLLTPDGPKPITAYSEGEAEEHDHIWAGQLEFAELTETEKWIFALKAGKLGFTELECAFDAWRLLFGGANSRVHIFSRADEAAVELLGYVRFGIVRLPPWMRPPIAEDERSGDTGHSLILRLSDVDKRRAVCYAAGPKVSIDQTCNHAHVDELSVMPYAEKTWNSVYSTVAPDGTCHVVTRGAGEVYSKQLWLAAKSGSSKLKPFFIPYNRRPGRDAKWREEESGSMTTVGLRHYAPETEDDALAGEITELFVPIELWDRCAESELSLLLPGRGSQLGVMGVDAGVKHDCFAVTLVTRHPDPKRSEDSVALRKQKLWRPTPGNEVNFAEPEAFIWSVCLGGCMLGHWKEEPWHEIVEGRNAEICPACVECVAGREEWREPWNIFEVTYDPHQMENTAQRGKRQGINFQPFDQNKARLIADSELRDLIASRRIVHDGNLEMREQMEYAGAKYDSEERKLRIIKTAPEKKVDLVVSLSMAAKRCLELRL